jgi:hypothetical protein
MILIAAQWLGEEAARLPHRAELAPPPRPRPFGDRSAKERVTIS